MWLGRLDRAEDDESNTESGSWNCVVKHREKKEMVKRKVKHDGDTFARLDRRRGGVCL